MRARACERASERERDWMNAGVFLSSSEYVDEIKQDRSKVYQSSDTEDLPMARTVHGFQREFLFLYIKGEHIFLKKKVNNREVYDANSMKLASQ